MCVLCIIYSDGSTSSIRRMGHIVVARINYRQDSLWESIPVATDDTAAVTCLHNIIYCKYAPFSRCSRCLSAFRSPAENLTSCAARILRFIIFNQVPCAFHRHALLSSTPYRRGSI